MFFGHFAVGLAARPVAPKVSLGVLLVATQVPDVLYAALVATGVISASAGASPWDHGLVMTLAWSAAAAAVTLLVTRHPRSSIVVGLLVLSHWIGDFLAWDHVLPLAFGESPRLGLGLYSSLAAMIAGDFVLFAGAIVLYLMKTKANDRRGTWSFWLMIAFILAMTPFCTLPANLLFIVGTLIVLLVPFGMWVDRHRLLIAPGWRTVRDTRGKT